MSMIEKFLEGKNELSKNIEEAKDEAMKCASAKIGSLIDEFAANVKTMIAEASEHEFIEFITSGKLEDDDILAAIVFRAQSGVKSTTEVAEEVCAKVGVPVHVLVMSRI